VRPGGVDYTSFNDWAQLKYWLSYSDADGNAATKYQFWDSGAGAGSASYWTTNGYVTPNTTLEVSAVNLSSVWVQGGSANGTDSVWVRAFDGHEWGNWDVFTLTTHNTPPVATISPQVLHLNEWTQVKDRLAWNVLTELRSGRFRGKHVFTIKHT
jgi:hypothetical protein